MPAKKKAAEALRLRRVSWLGLDGQVFNFTVGAGGIERIELAANKVPSLLDITLYGPENQQGGTLTIDPARIIAEAIPESLIGLDERAADSGIPDEEHRAQGAKRA